MSPVEVPRADLEADSRAPRPRPAPRSCSPGPPGAGKTTLLLRPARAARAPRAGPAVYLDLMGAASSPDRFVLAALDVLPAEPLRRSACAEATAHPAAGRRGPRPARGEAVRALFALWASLDAGGGRPVALLLDEATEIRSLAYFPGLREVDAAASDGPRRAPARHGPGDVLPHPGAQAFWPALDSLACRP